MANYTKMQQIKSGFISFCQNFNETAFPAQTFATPGIYATPLYSRYIPLQDPGFDGDSFFRSKKTIQGTLQHEASELTYSKLETNDNLVTSSIQISPQQVGHGLEISKTSERPKSPYNDEKMQEVLEKMRHPVYNVEVVNNDEPVKKLQAKKRKKSTKSAKSKSSDESDEKYFKWY